MTRKFSLALSAGLLLGAMASGAHAVNPALPVGASLTFQATGAAPKAPFTSVAPAGWTGGGDLIFVDSNASFNQSAAGPVYLQTYGNPVDTGLGVINYVEADGNPLFEDGFNTTITGLTPGQTYTLTFYQGASQQTGFNGGTTNQWIVALGGSGFSVCIGCGSFNPTFGSNESTYSDAGADIAASPLMTVPNHGTVGFNFVSVDLTANASSELLSFLAWGDNGTTANLPPMAFLTGVNAPPGLGSVPEPAVWTMMIVGLAGLGAVVRRQRRLVAATA